LVNRGSPADTETWLESPAIALEQRKPIDLLSTRAGVESVKDHLTRLEYGVYACHLCAAHRFGRVGFLEVGSSEIRICVGWRQESYLAGGGWNSLGIRAVYAALDPAMAILEVAVHKTFRTLDTVRHVLTSARIIDASKAHVMAAADVPNPNWLRPGAGRRRSAGVRRRHAAGAPIRIDPERGIHPQLVRDLRPGDSQGLL
jgi:hypothetical protein